MLRKESYASSHTGFGTACLIVKDLKQDGAQEPITLWIELGTKFFFNLRMRRDRMILAAVLLAGAMGVTQSTHAQMLPGQRAHHQLVYHPVNNVIYLIGGSTRIKDRYHYFTDIWSWRDNNWAPSPPLPFPRSSHRVVYHKERNSLILVGGGFQRAVKAEGVVWEWKNNEWRAVGGNFQAGRDEPGMCYDEKRDRIVLFGGWDGASNFRGDTWEWDGRELSLVDTTGPGPRAGHAFLYDPVRQQCLVFGGRGKEGFFTDTWTWDGTSWEKLDVPSPPARWIFGAAADPVHGRIVIFGGRGPDAPLRGRDETGDLGDTWMWDGEVWEQLNTEGPSPRMNAAMAFDGQNILLFGGRYETPDGFLDLNDTWILQGKEWKRVDK